MGLLDCQCGRGMEERCPWEEGQGIDRDSIKDTFIRDTFASVRFGFGSF